MKEFLIMNRTVKKIALRNSDNYYLSTVLLFISTLLVSSYAHALTFNLPNESTNIVGEVYTVFIEPGESLRELARKHNMGYEEIIRANQHINPRKPKAWSKVIIPSSFILPNTPRKGIVINLPEMRLYYYPKDSNVVMTFPIGVGKQGWRTPTTKTTIIEKKEDPNWHVPKSIKKYMASKGVILPDIVKAGPDNPLGAFAMKLNLPGYLIHGTNKPYSVGKRSSSGCIRMYPEDIEQLFYVAKLNDTVKIVNQPYKAGWYKNDLYLESHKPFEDQLPDNPKYDNVYHVVNTANKHRQILIDWDSTDFINANFTGYPQLITRGY
ncbi:MAG: L,D-transpeptidase family protein [Legionellales bacterium]|nr:L,D-transpeptidase family protein [Legionellales bacterium]